MDIRFRVGQNVRVAREESGLTQKHLADELGLASHSAVSDLEAGRRTISAPELARIGQLAGKALDWFFEDHSLQEDFVAMARAQGKGDKVKAALRDAERFAANYELLKKLLGAKGRSR